ncbi:MAG: PAS domain-containing protein [Brevinematales bacterium]|nr:PAS domain-containing protein [Brevinematales bacterium]
MGLAGLYFFVLFGVLFLFFWANLTNYKLFAARVLSANAFLFLVWIFAKLMLVSGIGWESTRFWLQLMTAVSWFLPATFLHLAIEIRRTQPGKLYYLTGIILTYAIPIVISLCLFLIPSFLPTKYLSIGQWIWDGFFSPPLMVFHLIFVGIYLIATLALMRVSGSSLGDMFLMLGAFFTFFLRTFLLVFDMATFWQGWFFWQPFLAFLSYLSLWLLYRKNFWLEESFSFSSLQKLLKDFSVPLLIIKKNHHIWYLNEAMKEFLSPSKSFSPGTPIEEYSSFFSQSDEFFEMLQTLSYDHPSSYRVLTFKGQDRDFTFYTHAEIIVLSRKTIAGYIFTFSPLESEKITQLAEKHVRLHKKLEEISHTYHHVLQTLEIPLFLTDTSWEITEINPAAYKLLGFNPEHTPLLGISLPFPRIIKEQMQNLSQQKFLFEVDFGGREWQRLHCQRRDSLMLEITVTRIGQSFLFLLRDNAFLHPQEERFHFESRFYRHVHQLTMDMLRSPEALDWGKILDTFVEIFPSHGYIVSLSEVQNNELVIPRALRGLDTSLIEKVENLLGSSLVSLPLRIPPHFSIEKNIMLSGKLNKITGGLQELFFYSINPMITMILEHMVGVGDIYAVGISNGETLYALLVVIIKKGYTFNELEWLEPFGEEICRILDLRASLLPLKNHEK